MATVAQITANRCNALKSTGPRTIQGKGRSSRNAVKWGLFSKHVVLTEDDAAEWELLSTQIRAMLQPVGNAEELLTDEVIANWFRLARCLKIDSGLFTAYSTYQNRACGLGTAFAQSCQLDTFGKLSRYEQHLERKLALSLQRLQSARRSRQETASRQLPAPATTSPLEPGSQPTEIPAKALEKRQVSGWQILVATVTAFLRASRGKEGSYCLRR